MNTLLKNLGMKGIIGLRWFWIVLLIFLIIPAWIGTGKIRIDSSNESFMPENDPVRRKNDLFKEIFGSEEFIYILVEADEIYSVRTLEKMRDLEADLRENLPFIDDIASIYSAEAMDSDGSFLRTESMEETGIPEGPAELDEFRRRHLSSLLYRNRLISENGETAGILITLEQIPETVYAATEKGYSPFSKSFKTREKAILRNDIISGPDETRHWQVLEDPRKSIAATLYVLLDEHGNKDFRLTATGLSIIDYGADVMTARESSFFGMLSLITASLLLIALYRSLRALIAPLLVFALTIFYLFGFMGLAGMNTSIMTIVLIPLLLVISVGYSIHMINQIRKARLEGLDRTKALQKAYADSAWPCLLTAVTTAAGFISFLFVPMGPIRQLGLQCALGTMTGFMLVMIIIPLFWYFGKWKDLGLSKTAEKGRRWAAWNEGLGRNAKPVLTGVILICGFSIAGMIRINPSSDMLEIIGEKAGFVRDTNHVARYLGGAYSAEVLIEFPEAGMALEPEAMRALVEAGNIARRYGGVSLTLSLADLVLELDRVLAGKIPEAAAVPGTRKAIAQYLLMYETSGGEILERWTDLDYRTLRLSIVFNTGKTDLDAMNNQIGTYLKSRLPAGTGITMTGDLPAMMRMMDLLIRSQVRSCLAALGFISLLLILVLRSFRLGFLAIIPNLFPILVTLGIMGWLGMRLDFVTAMVAPMLIGIAVDDTVHFFIHYRQARKTTGSPEKASEKTFLSVGNALVFTSIVLTGGFVLFIFSHMKSLQHMGVLAAAGIVSALFADICLSPLVLKHFDRNTIPRRNTNE
ncbi:MAG: MMPL family transporter [Spirochaetales bacterium]|nr:MMPL family transporter [Spirochaetales bacterium]